MSLQLKEILKEKVGTTVLQLKYKVDKPLINSRERFVFGNSILI